MSPGEEAQGQIGGTTKKARKPELIGAAMTRGTPEHRVTVTELTEYFDMSIRTTDLILKDDLGLTDKIGR